MTPPHQRLASTLASLLDQASVYTRVLVRSGAIYEATPRGTRELVKQIVGGRARGPGTIIRTAALNQPNKEAVISGGRRIGYAELDRRCDRLAAGLSRSHRIGRGDAVVLMMHNRGEWLEAQTALSRLGARSVSASYRSTPKELEYLVNHCEARAVIVESELADVLLAASGALESVPAGNFIGVGEPRSGLVSYEDLIAKNDGVRLPESEDAGAVIVYTSGTTGKPKGAVRAYQKDMPVAILRLLAEVPFRTDDRHLCVCPLYHSTGFAYVSFTVAVAGTVVIDREFEPERFLATIEREKITTTAVVPTMLHRVLALPPEVKRRYDTRSLRAVFCNAAPLTGALARSFIEEFGHVLYNLYGSTETGLNTLATPDELVRSPGTVGHVIPGNEIRLLDEAGREVPRGKTGEVYVRNAMLVAGYHRDDKATQQSMRDGFFSVGDLAHQDEHGLFHIDGRKRDMIISGGVNVYPAEVEEVIARHAAVAEVAVVGEPDDEWGERVCAFVALRPGMSAEPAELTAFARRDLAGPKLPRRIVVMSELPKNATGKILKNDLRRKLTAS